MQDAEAHEYDTASPFNQQLDHTVLQPVSSSVLQSYDARLMQGNFKNVANDKITVIIVNTSD